MMQETAPSPAATPAESRAASIARRLNPVALPAGKVNPLGIAIAAVIALVIPWVLSGYPTGRFVLHLAVLFLGWGVVVQSWNLILGVGGIFSFAQVALFAIGGLTAGVLTMQLGWSPWVSVWFAPIAATIAALIIGLPSLRLRGPYVVLLTLAFGELLKNFATQGPKWLAGGGRGLMNVPKFGFVEQWGIANGQVAYYYVALALFAVATIVIWKIFNSPIGMSFRALRDSETYATSRGVDPFRFRLLLFALSAFFTGLVGGFMIFYNGAQAPSVLSFDWTITLLAMIVLGGWGTFWGPILGTALLIVLPELLREVSIYRNLVLGLSLALIAVFAPEGLFPLASRWVKKLFGRKEKTSTGAGL
jgi:branched-chain amino acid transport system permease protein